MARHGNCSEHAFRPSAEILRSIGKITIEVCNNCLSVVVIQRRDDIDGPFTVKTPVEMKDSAYEYIK